MDINIKNEIILPEEIKNIVISKHNRGRKVNLYISGWDISEAQKKDHLKNLKKTLGCNGSIKSMIVNNTNENVLHLQGDHTSDVKNYLINNGVDENLIVEKL